MRSQACVLGACALLLWVAPRTVAAQQLSAQQATAVGLTHAALSDPSTAVRLADESRGSGAGAPALQAPVTRRASWWAPAASLLVPGTGQVLLGQQRSVAYAVAEIFLIAQATAAQRNVSNGIRDYQRVARDAARKSFGGALPTGPWRYYETLEKYDASGAFDMVPGGTVDPETDPTTYNGESWLLARTTYWNDPRVAPAVTSPEYQRALAFYVARAYRDEFAWSWRNAQLQKDVYVQAVSSTNRSNQRKTNILTVVGANHLASLVDAYITVRVRRYGGAGMLGVRLDGVETNVGVVGDPADGRRTVRTSVRLVPVR